MKKIIYIVVFFSLLSSCDWNSKTNNSIRTTGNTQQVASYNLKAKADELNKAYAKNNHFSFFKLFPNTYNEFLDLYGYNYEIEKNNILSPYSEAHIRFFFQCYELNEEKFIPKLFNLVKNGKWEADAPSYLQEFLINFILKNPSEVVEYLNNQNENDVSGFWYFVFDGSSKNDKQVRELFKSLYEKINLIDSNQGEILKKEFDFMYN